MKIYHMIEEMFSQHKYMNKVHKNNLWKKTTKQNKQTKKGSRKIKVRNLTGIRSTQKGNYYTKHKKH